MAAITHNRAIRNIALAFAILAFAVVVPSSRAEAAGIWGGPSTVCRSFGFVDPAAPGVLEIYPHIVGDFGETFWLAMTVQQATYDGRGNFTGWRTFYDTDGWIRGTLSGHDIDIHDRILIPAPRGTYYRVWMSFYADWGGGWSVWSSWGSYGEAGALGAGGPVTTPYCYMD